MFLFLDIDGVLNTKNDWKSGKNFHLSSLLLDNLSLALKNTSAKIILISSWRKGFIARGHHNNSENIKELENALEIRGLCIRGIVSPDENNREKAIKEFLKKFPEDYLILDDDINEYQNPMKHLYLVDCRTGLTKKDALKIQKLLKEE